MSEWTTTRIGDLLRSSNERSVFNDQYPVLTSSRSGLHLQSEYFNRVVASKDNTGYKVIRKGQFTYRAMSDDGFFRFNRLADHEAGIISPAYEVFECKTEIADPIFMDYLLNSDVVLSQIYGAAQGGTRLSLRLSTLSEFEAAVPLLPEQKKIAEILSGIDFLIKKSEEKIQKLQTSHASLSAESFCVRLNSESEEFVLGDIVTLRHGYQFRTPDFAQHGAKVIKISQVLGDGIVVTENCDRVPWELAADKEKFRLLPGDILMSLTGNIGRVGIVPETDEVLLQNYRVGLFEVASESITREYLVHLLESRHVVSQLEDNANASAQANFGKGDLDKVVVYLPNASVQRRTASLLTASKNLIKKEKQKAEVLCRIKESVSADLLSGRKRVSV